MAVVRDKSELLRDKRKPRITVSRRALLRAALKRLAKNSTLRDRQNRYNKSHRSPEKQDKYEARIVQITASRYNLAQGQTFPLEAIIFMAGKGVRVALKQYNELGRAAEKYNISVRKAYDYFVLGENPTLRKVHEPT